MKKIKLVKTIVTTAVLSIFFSIKINAQKSQLQNGNHYGKLTIQNYVDRLPVKHDGIIKDVRIIDRVHAGMRVFRIYKKAPMHYHAKSDAFLYILNGKAEFYVGDKNNKIIAQKGDLLFWEAGTAHGNGSIFEGPLDILIFDAASRDPADVIWIDPNTESSFLKK